MSSLEMDKRPWGHYKVLKDNKNSLSKRGKNMSLVCIHPTTLKGSGFLLSLCRYRRLKDQYSVVNND